VISGSTGIREEFCITEFWDIFNGNQRGFHGGFVLA
jgi:hypothetical protein